MIVNFIYNEKKLLINKASTGDIIYLDNKINLRDKDTLIKTSSNYLDKEILSVEEKKILININALLIDNYLEISFSDIDGNIVKDKVPVDIPLNRSTTNNEIIEKLSKLGGTPFAINNINIDINKDIFVNMKDLKYSIDLNKGLFIYIPEEDNAIEHVCKCFEERKRVIDKIDLKIAEIESDIEYYERYKRDCEMKLQALLEVKRSL